MNTTAILIFANSHGVDSARKNMPNSGQLFKALNDEIIAKVERTGLPFFLYSEELQIGSDFGSRFTAAIQSVFAKGFDGVITVGNDSPNLSVSDILKAHENLMLGKTVIGPSLDGGIYLLAIHKNRFEPIGFRQLPWQKPTLFQETARFFMRRGMLYQLPRMVDIDSAKDIQTVIDNRGAISVSLLRLLISTIRKTRLYASYRKSTSKPHEISHPFNKGSPSLSNW